MKTSLTIAAVVAMLAAPMLATAAPAATAAKPAAAKQTYCMDQKTHKRISCKAKPAAAAMAAKPAPAAAMAAKPTAMMAAKPKAKMAAASTKAKGVKCGNSYIAANKTCHK